MLWTLLTLTSSVTIVVSSFLAGRRAGNGPWIYLFVIGCGVIVSVINVFAMNALARRVANGCRDYSNAVQDWCFRLLYLAAVLWIPTAAFVGDWMSRTIIRLARLA